MLNPEHITKNWDWHPLCFWGYTKPNNPNFTWVWHSTAPVCLYYKVTWSYTRSTRFSNVISSGANYLQVWKCFHSTVFTLSYFARFGIILALFPTKDVWTISLLFWMQMYCNDLTTSEATEWLLPNAPQKWESVCSTSRSVVFSNLFCVVMTSFLHCSV